MAGFFLLYALGGLLYAERFETQAACLVRAAEIPIASLSSPPAVACFSVRPGPPV